MTTLGRKIAVVRGSGNVFRDFGRPDADALQLRAILGARIIAQLNRDKLTVRAAQARTGIAAADFSRIRNTRLQRFSIERLITILNKLDCRVDFLVKVKRGRSK